MMYYITQNGDSEFDCSALMAVLEAAGAYVDVYEGRTGAKVHFELEESDLTFMMQRVRRTGELWYGSFYDCTPGLVILKAHPSNPLARKLVAHILDNYSVSATDDEYVELSLEPFVS